MFSSLTEISQRIFRVALLFICQGTSKAIICVNAISKARFHEIVFMQRTILRQQSSSNFVARCALHLCFLCVDRVWHATRLYYHAFFPLSTPFFCNFNFFRLHCLWTLKSFCRFPCGEDYNITPFLLLQVFFWNFLNFLIFNTIQA